MCSKLKNAYLNFGKPHIGGGGGGRTGGGGEERRRGGGREGGGRGKVGGEGLGKYPEKVIMNYIMMFGL